MTSREEILTALADLVGGIPGIRFGRNETRPQDFEANKSLVGLFDGAPRQRTAQNGGTYEFEYAAEIEIAVTQAETAARDAEMDRIVTAINAALAADPTLGGLADYAEAEAPQDPEEAAIAGLPGVKFTIVTVVVWFVSDRATG